MAKLFLFGIGGTGSRVIKSLTMLLASGVKLGGNIDTVVPMIIDPDVANGDLTRTQQLLDYYQTIRQQSKADEGFFGTKISRLTEIAGDGAQTLPTGFNLFEGVGDQNQTFRDFIGYRSMSEDNKALVDLLFSPTNLSADMSVGFKGHPNIGSVVLNQFKNAPAYKVFLNCFAPGDSLFLISSIFGGTGAAGFPLLLRNLRKVDADFPGSKNVANAKIGALSMLPYFKINAPQNEEEQSIDSSTFVGKSKAALDYYTHSIFGNNSQLNAFYSLGEEATNLYDHHDGAIEQKNKAHFLELAASVAVVDFTNRISKLDTQDGRAMNTDYLEFGLDDLKGQRRVTIKELDRKTANLLKVPLGKFALMTLHNNYVLKNDSDFEKSPWYMHLKKAYNSDGIYETSISQFESLFKEWLVEMANNDICFDPFNLDVEYDSLLNFINGYELSGGVFGATKSGKRLEKKLNKQTKFLKTQKNLAGDYIRIFNKATETTINNIID